MGRKEINMKRLCLKTIPLTLISKNPSLGLTLAPKIFNPFALQASFSFNPFLLFLKLFSLYLFLML